MQRVVTTAVAVDETMYWVNPAFCCHPVGPGGRVAEAETQDPQLASWDSMRDFISWCSVTPEIDAVYFDMMACALYSDNNWKYVIDTLTIQTGVTIRASTDTTGAAALGGNWFLESGGGVNLKDVYFTEQINSYQMVLYENSYNAIKINGDGLYDILTELFQVA